MNNKTNKQMNEAIDPRKFIAISAIVALLPMSGVLAADKLSINLQSAQSATEIRQAFSDAVTDNHIYRHGYTKPQVISIVAKTLFGEARAVAERKAGGHYAVMDTILNRANGDIDYVVPVCLEKAQYSFWNGVDRSILTAENYDWHKIPPPALQNSLEAKAWQDCMILATDAVNKKYKARTNWNSYYVNKGPNKIKAPSWDKDMIDVKQVGTQKFGFVKTNTAELRPGSELRTGHAAKAKSKASVPTAANILNYKVKLGDRVSRLAKRYDCTMSEIQELNPGVDLNKIHPRQEIKIPVGPKSKYRVG